MRYSTSHLDSKANIKAMMDEIARLAPDDAPALQRYMDENRQKLAADLGIRGIKKLAFLGEVRPDGATDLVLEAHLGATVVQNCVVTMDPVTTRIEEPVVRHYIADFIEPEGDEVEMPEDETADPMPVTLDLTEIMVEALALALPPWPRTEGVEPVSLSVTEPGKTPMTDDDAKPFAALKTLAEKAANDGGDDG